MQRARNITRAATIALATFAFAATAGAQAPKPIYETAIPGYTIPHASRVVVDDAGNAFLIGSAYDDGVHLDVFVAKIGAGGGVQWTQYITGEDHNYATGIALDAAGDPWVSGWTDSPDFPTVNPMDATLTGFRDAFLMKLDADDGSIVYSTFLGGDYADQAEDIAIDDSGAIWLTGVAGSTDFPTTADAYQGEPSFPLYFFTDAFITKLSPTGDTILYSTYFGGQEDDEGKQISIDSAGDIVICGRTTAQDFPLVNPVQTAPNDIFVAKLSGDGQTLLFSTYLGGEESDRVTGMALDASDRACLVGITQSVGFPTTPGAYQEEFVGAINGCEIPFGGRYNCDDMFVTALATDGSGIAWSTFLGGTQIDEARDVAVGPQGAVYVAGYTRSDDFPPDGMDFGAEFLVSRLVAEGSSLAYTYSIDSGSANRGNGVAIDAAGSVYLTGTVGVPASIWITKLAGGVATTGVDVAQTADLSSLRLAPARPNPFRPSTRFEYVVPATSSGAPVRLKLYDVTGKLVRQLVDAPQSDGVHSVDWRGTDERGAIVPSGVYFARLEVAGEVRTQKVVKLRP